MSDYGSQEYIPDSQRLLNVQISKDTFAIKAVETECQNKIQAKEDSTYELRRKLRESESKIVDMEISNHILFQRYESLRKLVSLSDDPIEAGEQLAIINSIRLGLIPVSNQISADTQQKTTEIFCKPSVVAMAKDLTKLGLFYDAIIHLGTMVKIELNKVDTKTKVKIAFDAKVKKTEEIRTSPAPKPGRKSRTPEEKIIAAHYNMLLKMNGTVKEDDLFNLLKPTMSYIGSEVTLALMVKEYIKSVE